MLGWLGSGRERNAWLGGLRLLRGRLLEGGMFVLIAVLCRPGMLRLHCGAVATDSSHGSIKS